MKQPLLEVKSNDAHAPVKGGNSIDPILLYKGKPAFKFGPMSETATLAYRLGSKAYDAEFWADWQQKHGMGYVRCYPEQGYGWVDTRAEGRLYPFRQVKPLIFDLEQFDPEYWANFRDVALCLRERDVVIHLQIVQVCFFKDWNPESRRWIYNFWNPQNNVNEWTKDLQPDFPFARDNTEALAHWKRYIFAILDAVGDVGNVIFDIGNELNTDIEWIDWTIAIMEEWENKHQIKLLKGLDYTHVSNPSKILDHSRLDIIMTHGEYVDDAPVLRKIFGKPVVSVISRDGVHGVTAKVGYLELGEDGSSPDRFRRFHYRCLMNKVQGVGDYGKMMGGQEWGRTGDVINATVDPNAESIKEFARQTKILSEFFDGINNYEALKFQPDHVQNAPCPYYCLKSKQEVLIYLDAGKQPDEKVEQSTVRLLFKNNETALLNSSVKAMIFYPATGERKEAIVKVEPVERVGKLSLLSITIEAFKSDLMIYLKAVDG